MVAGAAEVGMPLDKRGRTEIQEGMDSGWGVTRVTGTKMLRHLDSESESALHTSERTAWSYRSYSSVVQREVSA